MNNPLISIIIPVYNAASYIDDCIESLLSQTYQNIEILLCDDCSTDNSREILKKYESNTRCKVLYNEKNLRQASTRNRCIQIASGDFIMMQDADDIATPDRVEKLLTGFDDSEKIDFVSSSCFLFDENGTFSITFKNSQFAPNNVSLLPTQLIFSFADFVNFCILLIYKKKNKIAGRTIALYMINYGLGRFCLEYIRGDSVRGTILGMSTAQFTSIFMCIIGCLLYGIITTQYNKKIASK